MRLALASEAIIAAARSRGNFASTRPEFGIWPI